VIALVTAGMFAAGCASSRTARSLVARNSTSYRPATAVRHDAPSYRVMPPPPPSVTPNYARMPARNVTPVRRAAPAPARRVVPAPAPVRHAKTIVRQAPTTTYQAPAPRRVAAPSGCST